MISAGRRRCSPCPAFFAFRPFCGPPFFGRATVDVNSRISRFCVFRGNRLAVFIAAPAAALCLLVIFVLEGEFMRTLLPHPARFRLAATGQRLTTWLSVTTLAAGLALTAGCPQADDDPQPDVVEPDSEPGAGPEPSDAGPQEPDAGTNEPAPEPAVEPDAEPGEIDAGPNEPGVDAGPAVPPDDGGVDDGGVIDGGPGDNDAGPSIETVVNVEVIGWGSRFVPEGEIRVGDVVVPIVAGRAELIDFPEGPIRGVVRAPGFAPANLLARVATGQTTTAQVILIPVGATVEFEADQEVSLNHRHVGVDLQPNSFVDGDGNPVTGVITAHITAFDPLADMPAAPGPFQGMTTGGDMDLIESFGMGEFTFTQNGEELQLADGVNALLRIGVPSSLDVQSGDNIPSWSYDLEAGHWAEEQMGSVSGFGDRLTWTASVSHFSWWNCDKPVIQKECVVVRIDSINAGPGIPVYSDGVDYAGVDVSTTDDNGEGCVEFKRGASANIHAGSGSHGFTYTLNVVGNGEPADCSGGGAGCSTILVDVPQLSCVRGVVTQNGVPQEGADAILDYGRSLAYKRTDATGAFCAKVPLSASVTALASIIDNTGSILTAEGFALAPGESADCGEPLSCSDLGQLELTTPPLYCLEGQADHINGFTGATENLPVGTALYAFQASTFTGINCATTPESWGSVLGTGTVGIGGAYCLNLPLGENNRDVILAADRCGGFECETELPDSSCLDGHTFTLSAGQEVASAGSQCNSTGTCAADSFVIEFN